MRAFLIFCALLPVVLDAYTNTQLQLVAAASESASASYTAKGAVPATGGTVAQSSSYTHYSGDAAGYIMQPAAQRNGVAYEWLADNDGDSLSDAIEVGLGSNLYAADTDADGLTDSEEYLTHGTSLLHADTDFDGSLDSEELLAGTSPLDASSRFVANIKSAPTDSSDQTSLNLNVGQLAAFSVTASASGLSYQWKKDGININGATSSSFTIASVSETDSGGYTVTISNSSGSAESNTASLYVVPATVISHWEPAGWVYYAWPYAYDSTQGRWHFFNQSNKQWRVNLSDSEWATLDAATGWNYYAWPYSYSSDQSTWHWYNSNIQWVVDLASGDWELFGGSD